MRKIVRKANQSDLDDITEIHHKSFVRQSASKQWIESTLAAYPRYFCYLIENEKTCGYIFWAQKSGFRAEVILELDQIAIHPDFQGLGLSKILIVESLKNVEKELSVKNQKIKSVLVSTGVNNFARKIYEDLLNANEVAIITDLYSSPEVYLKADREDLVFLN
ncbi:GNAT family N-acetyltransferase [Acinetobacter sp. ANC 4648]|uniref:GNAT family N-acetyltransferase n=1 Tax=Acinetobacter sp. ANC 4648 TaxID=1977875 RepID=UPI000A338332|nr:GNAT family N-acetyltransferase [Acinetobacter sp. ANC 4648]OTG81541.1 N-acetyltransferase [Acinetobacter sp. ANC 4648]